MLVTILSNVVGQIAHNDQCADDLTGWINVGVDDLGDEIRRQADYGDHGNEGQTTEKKEGFCERYGAIAWDCHFFVRIVVEREMGEMRACRPCF